MLVIVIMHIMAKVMVLAIFMATMIIRVLSIIANRIVVIVIAVVLLIAIVIAVILVSHSASHSGSPNNALPNIHGTTEWLPQEGCPRRKTGRVGRCAPNSGPLWSLSASYFTFCFMPAAFRCFQICLVNPARNQ